MKNSPTSYFDLLFQPVAKCLSWEATARLASLTIDTTIQSPIAGLASKANEGSLTEREPRRITRITLTRWI
jgi:hypothetical protein